MYEFIAAEKFTMYVRYARTHEHTHTVFKMFRTGKVNYLDEYINRCCCDEVVMKLRNRKGTFPSCHKRYIVIIGRRQLIRIQQKHSTDSFAHSMAVRLAHPNKSFNKYAAEYLNLAIKRMHAFILESMPFACLRRMRSIKPDRNCKTIINFIKSSSMRTRNSSSAIFLFRPAVDNKLFGPFFICNEREEKEVIEILNNGSVPAKSS